MDPTKNNIVIGSITSTAEINIVIPKETALRLLKDIKNVMTGSPSLESEGILYKHSDTDLLTGYACIVGPADSVYFGGYYFFIFKFPTNYPHSPPIVSYLTNTGNIRFHPNFYPNRKVCLSLLNTWRGEQWTGCQSIRSVLMTFISILDKAPLLYEPGIRIQHQDFNSYNTIIEYNNYEFACMQLLSDLRTYIKIAYYSHFEEFMLRVFDKNKDKIREIIENRSNTIPAMIYSVSLYGQINCAVSYSDLLDKYDKIFYPAIQAKMNEATNK